MGRLLKGDAGDSTCVLDDVVLDEDGRTSDDMDEFSVKRWLCSDCLRKASNSGWDSTAAACREGAMAEWDE